jgi:hypothetical protein
MPRYNVLYLVEHDIVKDNTSGYDKPYSTKYMTDSRLIILFDESEDVYYCFGTRRREKEYAGSNNHKYEDYTFAFPIDNTAALTKWVSLLNNKFTGRYTYEMHQIKLEEDEYVGLDFEAVYRKLTKYNELFAYDIKSFTEGDFMEQLDAITALANF